MSKKNKLFDRKIHNLTELNLMFTSNYVLAELFIQLDLVIESDDSFQGQESDF